MLTTFEQFQQWVIDNGIKHWALYKSDRTKEGDERYTGLVIDSNLYPPSLSIDEKLELTRRHLDAWGSKLYGQGFQKESDRTGALLCEVWMGAAPTSGIGMHQQQQQPFDIGKLTSDLRDSITKELKADWERKEFERQKREFEQECKEFKEMEAGVWGVLVERVGPMILGAQELRKVAGTPAKGADASAPTAAPAIQPLHAEQAAGEEREQQEDIPGEEAKPSIWDKFTEEEAERILTLMDQWRSADNDYMSLFETVVNMAVNGDNKYNMAKSFL